MKRFISILLSLSVLMLCVVSCALADDFSVRNGIHFGMSIDEVKANEKSNGIGYISQDPGWLSFRTSVAGEENTEVIYRFDDDDKLYEVVYEFNKVFGDTVFDAMSESLKGKYGEPLHSSYTDKTICPVRTYIFKFNTSYNSDRLYGNWNEWLVDYGDYYVLIDCSLYPDPQSFLQYGNYLCGISYRYTTEKEIEETTQKNIDDKNQEKEKVETEKDRDL